MSKYIFEKFKQNIFILNYNDEENNIKFKKLIKIPVTLELCDLNNEYNNYKIIEKTDYKNYFEKIKNIYSYKNINVYDDLVIYIEYEELESSSLFPQEKCNNIDINDIEITFNIKKLIDNKILSKKILIDNFLFIENSDYIDNKLTTDEIINYSYIKNISFLILNYNENNITLYKALNEYSTDKNIELIEQSLYKIKNLHDNLNFIHGDFKLNNILYNINTNNIIFIDLEFSQIIDKKDIFNNFIKINISDYINSYLLLKNNFYLNIDFLKFFDIYLFTFSFYMSNSSSFYCNKFINELNNKINKINLSTDKKDFFLDKNINLYIFILLYKILHKYSTYNNISLRNISDIEFYKYCRFNNIYKIYNSTINLFNNVFDKENSTNKYILLYINNMFDDIIIKNNFQKMYFPS